MAEYRLTPAFLSLVYKRMIISRVPLLVLALGVGGWIGGRGGDLSSNVLMIWVPLVLITVAFGLFRGVTNVKKGWSSYRLILEEDQLRRVQDGLPEVVIRKEEISKVLESIGRGITVKANAPSRQIHIPASLQDYSEVRLKVLNWHAPEDIPEAKARWNGAVPILAGLLTLGAFYITYTASNRYVVMAVGLLLCITLILCLVVAQRSREVPSNLKRAMWFVLLPILAIAARVLLAFHGH